MKENIEKIQFWKVDWFISMEPGLKELLMDRLSIASKMGLSILNIKTWNSKESGLMETRVRVNYFKVISSWWVLIKKRRYFSKKTILQLLLRKKINIFSKESIKMEKPMVKDLFIVLSNNINLESMQMENKMEAAIKWP